MGNTDEDIFDGRVRFVSRWRKQCSQKAHGQRNGKCDLPLEALCSVYESSYPDWQPTEPNSANVLTKSAADRDTILPIELWILVGQLHSLGSSRRE